MRTALALLLLAGCVTVPVARPVVEEPAPTWPLYVVQGKWPGTRAVEWEPLSGAMERMEASEYAASLQDKHPNFQVRIWEVPP